MISTDMPTSGTVIFPVRTRASVSCSDGQRRAQRRALGGQRPGDRRTGGGPERSRGGDLLQLDQLQVVAELRQGRHERAVRRLGDDDPPPELDEQPAVTGARRLAQRALVADVGREQHGDHVEVRRQLVAQVAADVGRPRPHRDVHEQRGDRRADQGDAHRHGPSQRHHTERLTDRQEQRRGEQPDDGGGDEHRRVRFRRPLHETQVGQDCAVERTAAAVDQPSATLPARRRIAVAHARRGPFEVGDHPPERRAALGHAGDQQPDAGDADERCGDEPPDHVHRPLTCPAPT